MLLPLIFRGASNRFIRRLPTPRLNSLVIRRNVTLLRHKYTSRLPTFFRQRLYHPRFPTRIRPPNVDSYVMAMTNVLISLKISRTRFFVMTRDVNYSAGREYRLASNVTRGDGLLSKRRGLETTQVLFFCPSLLCHVHTPFRMGGLYHSLPRGA